MCGKYILNIFWICFNNDNLLQSLEDQVKEHEKYQCAYTEALDWVKSTKTDVQEYSDTHGEKDRVIEREKKVNEIIDSLSKGDTLISRVIESNEAILPTTGEEGQEAIKQDVEQLKNDWKTTQRQCHESKQLLENCISTWCQFTNALNDMKTWIDQFQKKISESQLKGNKTPEDLKRCKQLVDEAVNQKVILENLGDKCEALLEMSACSWARDMTVQLQSMYTSLLTEAQGLVSKVEKNLADHTEFLQAKGELKNWLDTAHGSVQDCVGVGNAAWARDKLKTLKVSKIQIPFLHNALHTHFVHSW